MSVARDYMLEICWLFLLVLLLTLTPAKPLMASGRDYEDEADECPGESGWCIPDRMMM